MWLMSQPSWYASKCDKFVAIFSSLGENIAAILKLLSEEVSTVTMVDG
jgi:hypothetical protein